ncbi:baseplate J/gp47 family protein [Clostridium sp. CF012]|uniref:baseplate J/gp47 family protein n=1 Tax=Clostridium sp. CF012 TaxID=2843319 RepID=UPI001C0BE0A6|nr:baseplate J/gp47 family protein [Clostridium sp. CF012]MBU3146891.1 baseplate J/gp47 family protein [Clostridium sp. CF012]
MYENMTAENILIELLANVSNDYEKSLGYPTADILKSFSIEENKLYKILQSMIDKLDVDLLTGDYLTKYVLQRKGIIRKIATKSPGILNVIGSGEVKIGDLFSTSNGIQFISIEDKTITTSLDIKIEAVIAGASGNVGSNSIVQMPVTLAGIVSCNNIGSTHDGYNAESDDSLRQRYYDALQLPTASGNRYDYMTWAKEVTGVGDAKIISLWSGANTVKVVIIDSDKQPASADLIKKVQDYIDPNSNGKGEGQAPIGAYTTVISATSKAINIDLVDIQEATNYTLADITISLKTDITNYLKEVAFKQDYVSYAKIGNVILNTEGVADYTTLTINGGNVNINILNEEVATLGVVNVV